MIQGLPLPVVARLLGHSNVRMTLRYAHVRDREIEAAAERVGVEIASLCGGVGCRSPGGPKVNPGIER